MVAEAVLQVYRTYFEALDRALRSMKPLEGAFGMGGGPAAAPCHDRFAEDLEAALAAAAPTLSPEDTRDTLRFIFKAPAEHGDIPAAYWMLAAVHTLTIPLIENLAPADAEVLHREYEQLFPRRDRLKPQKEVLSALKKRAGAAG